VRTTGLLFVLCVGCGSVGSGDDAAIDAPHTIDSDLLPPIDATAPRCDPTRPFGTPQAMGALNSPADDVTASLSPDELTVYFSSTRAGGAGGYDIYFATRASIDDPFGTPQLLNGVNTASADLRPMVTADGLTLFKEHFNGTDYDIDVATRGSTSVSFGTPAPDPGLNQASGTDDAETILPDGSQIYFHSSRDGGGAVHFYTATWNGAAWSTPVHPTGTGLDSAAGEDYPFISPDNLTLYFSSMRSGGIGGHDIWRAHRDSVIAGFGAPVLVAEIATVGNEVMDWASADDCLIVFTAAGSGTGQDLFIARRAP
jgi:hypothetical protein